MDKKVYQKNLIFTVMLLIMVLSVYVNVYAAGVGDHYGGINMSFTYGIISIISFGLAVGYFALVKNKEPWMMLLFVSVFVVNLGYFSLSLSSTLEEALLSNRIAYLGSVFLPLSMLMTIINVCHIKKPNWFVGVLLIISIAVFIIAASPGFLTCYYKEVSLIFVNGMAKLEKVYGPLHFIYMLYLLTHFVLMIGSIFMARHKDRAISYKHAELLVIIVCLNITIWLVEQFIYYDFEFLSVSYIVSELLLLVTYRMMQEYDSIGGPKNDEPFLKTDNTSLNITGNISAEFSEERIKEIMEKCQDVALLTAREKDVLAAILENKKRKEIAEELNVTEHTIKKHTANIFSKFDVTNRSELFEKVREYSN